jgi:hypothetical protein
MPKALFGKRKNFALYFTYHYSVFDSGDHLDSLCFIHISKITMTATIIEKNTSKSTQKQHYASEEHLALEEKAEFKHEYRDGEIVAMTGGTTNHNKLA